jgi:hypothetical protein
MELPGVDFTVHIDQSAKTMRLADNGVYAPGVQSGIKGYFSVIQPDGMEIPGSALNPSVVWTGLSLTYYVIGLRLAIDGCIQNGEYKVSYTVNYPGYDPTTVTKTFVIDFPAITLDVVPDMNVFIPDLKVRDKTNYSRDGYTHSILRNWAYEILNVAPKVEITTPLDYVDLSYNGEYYDAYYNVDFAAVVTYVSVANSWLTIAESFSTSLQTFAQNPGSFENLISRLECLKSKYDSYKSGCVESEIYRNKYSFASSLFQHLVDLVKIGDAFSSTVLENYMQATEECSSGAYVPSNTVIPPFDINEIVVTQGDVDMQNIGGEEGIYKDSVGTNPKVFRLKTLKTAGLMVITPVGDVLEFEYRNKDIFIEFADTSRSYEAGMLVEKAIVIPTGGGLMNFRIGTTPGGEELIMSQPIPQNAVRSFTIDRYQEVAQTIYFSGINAETKIIVILDKVLGVYSDSGFDTGNGMGSGGKLTVNASTDVSVPFDTGFYVKHAVLVPSVPLSAFKVGTTNGGTEIINESSIPAGASFPIKIDTYCEIPKTFYFGGITGPVVLIVYYE